MDADEVFVPATYRSAELPALIRSHGRSPVIVFDLETNGLSAASSVVSCAALKFSIDPARPALHETERFLRYYFPEEQPDPRAERVHGLTIEEIGRRRGEADYPRHFSEDPDFADFCADVPLFVAHNIDFDAAFVPFLLSRDRFCTMKSNNRGKWPKLHEAARRYGVEYDPSLFHDSLYDAQITARIFDLMLQRLSPEDLPGGELFPPS